MATIGQDTISSCPIVAPDHSEQDGIVEWIDRQWWQLSRAIEDANRQIVLVREYRSRLIADVVTGKLDVCDAAARLPEVGQLSGEGEANGVEGGIGSEPAGWRSHAERANPTADLGDAARPEAAAGKLMTGGR